MKTKTPYSLLSRSLAALCLISTHPLAADQTWSGASSDNANWSNNDNWTASTAPGSTEIAVFNSAIVNDWGSAATPILVDSSSQGSAGIRFSGAVGSYTIGTLDGHSLTMNYLSSGTKIEMSSLSTASTVTQTINASLVIGSGLSNFQISNNSNNGTGANTGILNIAGNISGSSGTQQLTIRGTNTNNNTLGGLISNGGASTLNVLLTDGGKWLLTNDQNSFNGTLSVNNGTLSVNSIANSGVNSSIGAGSKISLGQTSGGGTLLYTGATAETNRTITLNSGSTNNQITNSGTGTLTLNGEINGSAQYLTLRGNSNIVVNGLINTGTSKLRHTDSGTLTLTNSANSFTGDVEILNGTLVVHSIANSGAASALGAGSKIQLGQNNTGIYGIGALRFTGAGGGSSDRAIVIGNGTSGGGASIENTIAGQTLTLSGAITTQVTTSLATLTLGGDGDGVLGGAIANGSRLNLTKNGSGTWTISSASTYTGTTTVNEGRLALTSTGALSSTDYHIAASAVFDVSLKSSYTLTNQSIIMDVNTTASGLLDGGTSTTFDYANAVLTLNITTTGESLASTYTLFSFSDSTGDLGSISLTGSLTGSLVQQANTDTWMNTFNDEALILSFDQSTGILSVSSVPEPATCAAIVAISMLACAVILRRYKRSIY